MKRFVFTSTIGTVWTVQPDARTFNEEDWNENTMPDYEAGHRDLETTYFSSKIFAERGEIHVCALVLTSLTPHEKLC